MGDSRYWDKKFMTEFIRLYQSFPCLWKVKSKDYSNKTLKKNAYERLIKFCRQVQDDCNRDFVTKKIQSLRGSFRKESKRIEEAKKTGQVYVPSLWYFDLLEFTKDQDFEETSTGGEEEERETYFSKKDLNTNSLLLEYYQSDCDESDSPKKKRKFQPTDSKRKLDEESKELIPKIIQALEKQQSTDIEVILESSDNLPSKNTKFKTIYAPKENEENNKFSGKIVSASTTSTLDQRHITEFEAVSINVCKKLERMDEKQAILAETLINQILSKGLLRKLTERTFLAQHENTTLEESTSLY